MDNRKNSSQPSRRKTTAQTTKTAQTTRQKGSTVSRQSTSTTVRPGQTAPARRSTAAAHTGEPARNTAASARRRTNRSSQRTNTPDVVYTPPAPFSRGKLLVGLACAVAVVLALVFGISIFFHVETIHVSGSEKYDAWTIREASGLKEGDSLLSVNDAQVSGNIITKLPYVKSVRVGIKLPNTVNIYIEEQDVVYAIRCSEGHWWLVTDECVVIERVKQDVAGERPQILGVVLDKPEAGKKGVAAEPHVPSDPETTEPEATGDTPQQTHPPVTMASDQLDRAMQILNGMRDEKIIAKIVNVDVSDLGNMQVQYALQYTILLGNTTDLAYKLSNIGNIILAVDEAYGSPTGTIDVSGSINGQYVFTYDVLPG